MNFLYFLPIEETINFSLFKKLYYLVSNERKKQVDCFHSPIDKKLSIYSELLLRIIICDTFKIRNNNIVLEKTKYGKPYLKGYSNFHFSISHTRNAIVLTTSNSPIGIDIEKIKNHQIDISKRFFTKREQSYINEDELYLSKRFYEIWTKKEAYIKYLGFGLSLPLNSFDVLCSNISKCMITYEINNYIISLYNMQIKPKLKVIKLDEGYINKIALLLTKP